MILAEKIIQLRKKTGMSQEELAEKIGVSRQAVSKWESGMSTPDMNKILALSEFFGVSTDFLLKDDIEMPDEAPAQDEHDESVSSDGEPLHPVDMETANSFLKNTEKNAGTVALGVMLCIFSPVAIILLPALGSAGIPISTDMGIGIGAVIMLVLIGIAVALFVSRGIESKQFDYLKVESIDTAYGVDGMVSEKRKNYTHIYSRDMILGITMCVMCSVPLIVFATLYNNIVMDLIGVVVLLVIVGCGVYLIVRSSTIWVGFNVLLEEKNYSRDNKRMGRNIGGIYWLAVTSGYMLVSFLTRSWDITWLIYPVAGLAYKIVAQIYKNKAK